MTSNPSLANEKLTNLEKAAQVDAAANGLSPSDRLNSLKDRLGEFIAAFRQETLASHEQQYEQILEQDIALQPRIKAMQQEDERIVALMGELQSAIGEMDDSTVTNGRIVRITNQIRGLIADVRAQSEELLKWLNESLLRDRGFSS